MRHPTGAASEQGHGYISRSLTRTEMQFFSYTLDEREAVALATVRTLPADATYAQIEDTVLKCFTAALEYAGLKDSIEYVGGQRRDTLRDGYVARRLLK
jgi:hypothetical protein